VGGHGIPTGGQFDTRSADTLPLTVTAWATRRKLLPRRFRCPGTCGPGTGIGLLSDDLGFCSHGLRLPAEEVSGLAGFRRFPLSLYVTMGFVPRIGNFPFALPLHTPRGASCGG